MSTASQQQDPTVVDRTLQLPPRPENSTGRDALGTTAVAGPDEDSSRSDGAASERGPRTLINREAERAAVEEVLENASTGVSGALVLRGEPGVGKTKLLEHARTQADGFRVLVGSGVEPEAGLPFGGLLALLNGVVDEHLGDLPHPQRRALATALGLEDHGRPDRFAVAAATLCLLAHAAERAPVLVVADDVHWFDPASSEALLFAARRLGDDAVAMLFATREGEGRPVVGDGLSQLELRGLERSDALALLAQNGGPPLASSAAGRLVELTSGNPLALLELAGALTSGQREGREPIEEPLPVGPRLERAYRGRLLALSDDSRLALLVAAASEGSELNELTVALGGLGLDGTAFETAEAAGLVSIEGPHLKFRHPLLRSVTYHAASSPERRRAHRALAAALSDSAKAGRRAWHLARAAVGPDEGIARELEQAADVARRRAAPGTSGAALEGAARLSGERSARVRRLLDSASAFAAAGRPDRAVSLADEVLSATDEPTTRADLVRFRSHAELTSAPVGPIRSRLLQEASSVEPHDRERAGLLVADASFLSAMAGEPRTALEQARRAASLLEGSGERAERTASHALGVALVLCGEGGAARGYLDRAQGLAGEIDLAVSPHLLGSIGLCYLWIEDFERGRAIVNDLVSTARREGAPTGLPWPLSSLALADYLRGDWTLAHAQARESLELARQTNQAFEAGYSLTVLARLEAGQGHEPACQAHVSEAIEVAERFGAESLRTLAASAGGLLELGLGRPQEALEPLRRVARFNAERGLHEALVAQSEPDLVEALYRVGELTEADAELTRLEQLSQRSERAWAQAAAARCRGLMADESRFEEHFERALSVHQQKPVPFEIARTELCRGERLRRARRRRDAREALRRALETFERLGAEPWAARCRQELGASGERLRSRDPAAVDALSPQELQVAIKVSEGGTNREVATALFISPRTVDAHLTRIFRKLGVRSRTEMARRLEQGEVT